MKNKINFSFGKIFTVVFSLLLTALTVFAFIYLAVAPDFVAPVSFKIDDGCYDYTIDEFADFLMENDYIDSEEYVSVQSTEASEVRKYGEIYVLYWNTSELETNDKTAYASWKRKSNVGNTTLSDGSLVMVYGCFGVSYKEKAEGEEEESYRFLEQFPSAYSGKHSSGVIEDTVWDYTFDEFEDYLSECGFITKGDYQLLSTIGTINRLYNGIDTAWWDVENLAEGTEAYDYWNEFQENGYIMFGGTVYMPVFNGPFALYATSAFPGDTDALYEALSGFPLKYSKKHPPTVVEEKTVWDYSVDDMVDYLDSLGFIDKDDFLLMSTIGTVNRIYSGMDFMWWDVENLAEGTEEYDYWTQFQENGYIMFGGMVYIPVVNGPFGINATAKYAGNADELYEAFNNFPKNYMPSAE